MAAALTIGILRETKVPPDLRVPFSPGQCRQILEQFPAVKIFVQPSPVRCFTDEEYREAGIPLRENLEGCDLLMGIKEVDKATLLPERNYLFFAHVAKKQAHNRTLLQKILEKKISLIDYEYLTREDKTRVVAFGRWAGIVGAYNTLRGWGLKTGRYSLKPAWQCFDRKEMEQELVRINPGKVKILITGEGRVAGGVIEVLKMLSIPAIHPEKFCSLTNEHPSLCQLGPQHYVRNKDGRPFQFMEFIEQPEQFESVFSGFYPCADILIAGHYWDPRSPVFFSAEEVCRKNFRISLIGDISCDIPGPLPTTLRASSIRNPFYDVERTSLKEIPPFSGEGSLTVMSVDNLPAELPRDASVDFGDALIRYVLPELMKNNSTMIQRATIVKHGILNDIYLYLKNFALEKED